jgi:hypothetical protein
VEFESSRIGPVGRSSQPLLLQGNSATLGAIHLSGDSMDPSNRETAFKNTGAVEQDRPEQKTNVAPFDEQLDHRSQDPMVKSQDSGLPGQGQTPEFTGENESNNELDKDTTGCEAETVKQVLTKESHAMNRMDTPEKRDMNDNDRDDEEVDQDPGERQKENQNEKKDDDLAA